MWLQHLRRTRDHVGQLVQPTHQRKFLACRQQRNIAILEFNTPILRGTKHRAKPRMRVLHIKHRILRCLSFSQLKVELHVCTRCSLQEDEVAGIGTHRVQQFVCTDEIVFTLIETDRLIALFEIDHLIDDDRQIVGFDAQ